MDTTSPHGDPQLTLDDLCERASVTIRTVRYYISEGLLPPAIGGGPAARYGQEHLDRLAVIAALKDRYLPLREIRRTLEGMPAKDIATLAAISRHDPTEMPVGTPQITPLSARMMPREHTAQEISPAAEYITDVLDREQVRRHTSPRASPEPESRSWKRIPISAEAELLIDEETWRRRREQIESLVTWAQRILGGS